MTPQERAKKERERLGFFLHEQSYYVRQYRNTHRQHDGSDIPLAGINIFDFRTWLAEQYKELYQAERYEVPV